MSILNSTKTGLQRYAMYICNYEEFYKKTLVDCAFYDTQRAIIELGKRQAKQQFKNRNIKKNVFLYLISKNTTTTRYKVLMQFSIPTLFPGYVANHKKDFKDANEFFNKNFPLHLRKRTKYIKYYEQQWKNKAITELYFPGSVFKVITCASALEEEVISLSPTPKESTFAP